MKKEYPADYKGPKAGKSTQEEWITVRDYDAFKYIRDGVWSYSDFDCWFYSWVGNQFNRGKKAGFEEYDDALKQFQKIQNRS
jgi:hypothetical protein